MLGCEVMVGDGTLVVIGALAVTSVPSLTAPTRYFFASPEPGATVIFDPSSKVISCFFSPSTTTVFVEVTVTRTLVEAEGSWWPSRGGVVLDELDEDDVLDAVDEDDEEPDDECADEPDADPACGAAGALDRCGPVV